MDLSQVNKKYYKIYMRIISELILADKELSDYEINCYRKLLEHFDIRLPSNKKIEEFIEEEFHAGHEKLNIGSLCKDMTKEDVKILVDILEEIISLNKEGKDIRELELIEDIKSELLVVEYSNKKVQILFGITIVFLAAAIFLGVFSSRTNTTNLDLDKLYSVNLAELVACDYFIQRIARAKYENEKGLKDYLKSALFGGYGIAYTYATHESVADLLYQGTVKVSCIINLINLSDSIKIDELNVIVTIPEPELNCSVQSQKEYTRQIKSELVGWNSDKEKLQELENMLNGVFAQTGKNWIKDLGLWGDVKKDCLDQVYFILRPMIPKNYKLKIKYSEKRGHIKS